MEGCMVLPLDDSHLKTLVDQAKDYLLSHGLVLRTVKSPGDADTVTHAPVTLLPSPVPSVLYEQALHVQNDINLLMHNIAHDYDFLKQCLAEVIKVDDFTRHLWEIYNTVTTEGISQPYSLGLNRSDYMFDCGRPTTEVIASGSRIDPTAVKLRMIEVNTMASSFGGLSEQLEGYHRFILDRVNLHESSSAAETRVKDSMSQPTASNNAEHYISIIGYSSEEPGDLSFKENEKIAVIKKESDWWTGTIGDRTGIFPEDYVMKCETPPQPQPQAQSLGQFQIPPRPGDGDVGVRVLAKGMVTAWECYGNPSAVVVFLVLDMERNVYDQRHLEYSVYNINNKVKVIYRTLKDVKVRGHLTEEANLTIDGFEVAVVYQRCLYSPDHYTTEEDWSVRMLLERSRAIKCPSAGYHLAGTKKVQQVLARPGVVERYVSDPDAARRIRDTFAGQYSLDLDEEGDKAVSMAMENPHLYVLKPQREGGGNNIFGDDIRTKLAEIRTSSERTAYILMDHIHPYPVENYMLHSGESTQLHTCVSELGIYGAFIGTQDKVLLNCSGGNCLRTKTVGTNEGGVATGYSCLDSPFLV